MELRNDSMTSGVGAFVLPTKRSMTRCISGTNRWVSAVLAPGKPYFLYSSRVTFPTFLMGLERVPVSENVDPAEMKLSVTASWETFVQRAAVDSVRLGDVHYVVIQSQGESPE